MNTITYSNKKFTEKASVTEGDLNLQAETTIQAGEITRISGRVADNDGNMVSFEFYTEGGSERSSVNGNADLIASAMTTINAFKNELKSHYATEQTGL